MVRVLSKRHLVSDRNRTGTMGLAGEDGQTTKAHANPSSDRGTYAADVALLSETSKRREQMTRWWERLPNQETARQSSFVQIRLIGPAIKCSKDEGVEICVHASRLENGSVDAPEIDE